MREETIKNEEDKHAQLLAEMEMSDCTLILGPEFCVLDKAETLAKSICDFIADTQQKLPNIKYVKEDGFFYTVKNTKDTFIDKNIQKFYKDLCSKDVPSYYNLIAQLPFKFIISLSPDDLLHQAFKAINRKHRFIYFKKGPELRELQEKVFAAEKPASGSETYFKTTLSKEDNIEPLPSEPILFNLMGIYDDVHSLVATHSAFFEFLYSIFPPEAKLKDDLKNAISNSTSFLCLGFQYNKWYLKIIFFIIEKIFQKAEQRPVDKTAIYISSDENHKTTVNFYENQFNIVFTPSKTLDFLYEIYASCDQRKLLNHPIPLKTNEPYQSTNTNNSKFTILHLSSAPDNTMSSMNFDNEFKKIEDAWRMSHFRDNFSKPLRSPAATQEDFMNKIEEEKPDLLIISAHGKQNLTLAFADEKNAEVSFSLTGFIEKLKLLATEKNFRLKCIIFNCCYSDEFARAVSETHGLVDFAIGMNGLIPDKVIPVFIESFLTPFFNTRELPYAYQRAIDAMKTNTGDYEDDVKNASHQPKLFSKNNS